MQRTHVYLTEEQAHGLRSLAERTGRSQSEVLRTAVAELLKREKLGDWRDRMDAAFGMWRDRDDIEELMRDTRAGIERRFEER